MSDDDRMDRAERIRNMREGNRGTEEETADDAETTTDETTTATEETETTTTDTEPTTTATEATKTATTGTESASTATDKTTETPAKTTTPTTETQPSATTEAAGTGSGTDASPEAGTADDDATAAAQRAAASASDVMGEGAETVADPGGDPAEAPADTTGGGGLMGQGPTGVELPDQQLLEEAMDNSTVTSTEGGARATAMEGETNQAEELVRVLEFALGDEYYCLDIEYVEEIVKRSAVTRVPNTPDFVDGVVDLRGQITTILEPKEMMDIEAEGEQNLIIVFDPDQFEEQGAVGWVVDEVRQVVPVTEDEVNSPPVDADYINGVIDREEYDQFVIWVEPDDALEQATSTDEE